MPLKTQSIAEMISLACCFKENTFFLRFFLSMAVASLVISINSSSFTKKEGVKFLGKSDLIVYALKGTTHLVGKAFNQSA
jgi:hypothetical protein